MNREDRLLALAIVLIFVAFGLVVWLHGAGVI